MPDLLQLVASEPQEGVLVAVLETLGAPELAADAGVNFVSFPIGTPWPKPGAPVDWADVDEACATVLAANSNALLIPRIGMDPPTWWREAHPADVMQWEDGKRSHAVVASPQYRHDAVDRLAALVAHIEEKFGDYVAGSFERFSLGGRARRSGGVAVVAEETLRERHSFAALMERCDRDERICRRPHSHGPPCCARGHLP